MAEKLKIWNWFSPWHACCLLGYKRLREPTNQRSSQLVTRMHDLASEFSKIFWGWYPGPPQKEGHSLSHPLLARPVPRCWDPNLGPLTFSAVVVPLDRGKRIIMLAASSDKRNLIIWRPSVCLSRTFVSNLNGARGAYSKWFTREQHPTWQAYISVRVLRGRTYLFDTGERSAVTLGGRSKFADFNRLHFAPRLERSLV